MTLDGQLLSGAYAAALLRRAYFSEPNLAR
jgi:hypothetical protein